MRGDRVGIVGSNGAGKSTLLKLMLGKLEPNSGSIRLGTNLQIAYFDQLRQALNEELTVQENVGDGYETIKIGDRSQHVLGYLQDFLFTPERARTKVRYLSGGERNRILLAKLFAKPANLVVLDEPTNDLDAETLELLEERLGEFSGTVLLVSHDREFLNQVVTSTFVFEDGNVKEYAGGYDDWQRQRAENNAASPNEAHNKVDAARSKSAPNAKKTPNDSAPGRRKLKFKEQKELEQLPSQIEDLEAQLEALHTQTADPDFYKQAGPEIAAAQQQVQDLQLQLSSAYARWEELEAIANG